MIGALRRRFVLIAMLCLTVTLAVLVSGIHVIYGMRNRRSADFLLHTLYENDGTIPNRRQPKQAFPLTEETPYETRYFIVTFDADGALVHADLNHIAAFDRDSAAGYVKQILALDDASGYFGQYRYAVQENADGGKTVLVLDCHQQQQAARAVLLIMLAVAGMCWLAVLLLLICFSKLAVRPFAQNLQKQKQFITDASHELKTPLAIISANAEALSLTAGDNEWLGSIRNQTQRLNRLIESLVALARTEETPGKLDFQLFDLSAAAQEVFVSFAPVASAKGCKLDNHMEQGVTLCGAQESLRQLLSILLENAVKYTLPDGTITVSLSKQGRGACLCVKNDSQPIPPDKLAHLFDRFYRADTSRARATGGYGIGLSMVQAIVRQHHGRLTVSQADGKITFTAVL